MNGFIEYAAFAGAIISSIGLALGLEWLGLNGLFRLMPHRAQERTALAADERGPARMEQRK